MARSRANLQVVRNASPPTAEDVLRDLFATEAELDQLALANRRLIDKTIDAYAKQAKLLARPRIELLRTRFRLEREARS